MKYDQNQYDWQRLAAEADAVACTKYESEDLLQNACVLWFNHFFRKRGMLFAIPNGGSRGHIAEALKFVATGTKAGAADLILLQPEGNTIFIELKNRKDYIDPEQAKFMDSVAKLGFLYFMANTFHQFAYLIFYLLDIPKTEQSKYL